MTTQVHGTFPGTTANDVLSVCSEELADEGKIKESELYEGDGFSVEKGTTSKPEGDAASVTESYSAGSKSNSEDDVEIQKKADNNEEAGAEEKEELNPWSKELIGIPINYFSVGVVYAGSVSILYPVLVIQHGVDTAFFTAAASLVTVFWSFKIFFGILCDCLPIYGQKWKPYITVGWILCAAALMVLASMGKDVSPTSLVIMLTLANLGYVAADVAADGMMVWVAHQEPDKKRGSIQTLIYIVREIGRICINIIIIIGFSGPHVNCPGFETDSSIPCTTDETVTSRNDLFEENPDTWCYMQCDAAQFNFGLTIPQYVWIIVAINLLSVPSYFTLKEERKERKNIREVASSFWLTMKKRAVWQVMLYSMVSSITFNIFIAAKTPANFVWLGLTTLQNQVLNILESLIFFLGLWLIRRYALNFSWRKMIWIGSLLVAFFNLLYLLIVFDIYRNPWFYIFTDVSDTFMVTLNFMASVFAIVEVSEPGFEAITYSLITTAANATIPLSVVIAYQFLAFMPDLNSQDGLAADTPEVRRQFAYLVVLTEVINLSSLLSLPMLPRQKEESRELVKSGEQSAFWAKFTLITGFLFLVYSTCITFLTVAGADKYGCMKILGGAGCTEDESNLPVYFLIGVAFLYCYGLNFYFTFWPIIRGEKKFSWGMFF
ncbi:Folate-Biopterin Transporter (FBT) Family [Seminavis robusta]|uniref:Folate-Biopterin Transporter (FBT) Family n=1 Tax=Seminavis robusta TaxID=568900 RepID=A0A9N8DBW4_9STRA|nr:Folate-Biopterin Transporter (FBT) Family [Seminavis robusta]|eukprot:Sro10_g008390.1 Folate-Biopterin Transporter (FBT) Family (662) ;mRNA; r:224454-226804